MKAPLEETEGACKYLASKGNELIICYPREIKKTYLTWTDDGVAPG
jgi:hypothetical protein